MTAGVLTAGRVHHARIRFPRLYRLTHRAPVLPKRTPPQDVTYPYPRADADTLRRVIAGLKTLPGEPRQPSAAPFDGASLAGLPDGVIAVKETGRDTVTFPAVQSPAAGPVRDREPYTSIGIRGADNYLRCSERLIGEPAFDGLGADKEDGSKYVALLLGAGQSDAAKPGDQWEIATDSPDELTGIGIAVIEALPELTSDSSFLERLIFAAQNALNAQTMGGPSVEQDGGAQ
jgi:hypothetical protein